MRKVFDETGDWKAVDAATKWCEENGFSIGTMQSTAPRGLKLGQYNISKWRNLSDEDIAKLDGTMSGNMRNGPVVIELHRNYPIG